MTNFNSANDTDQTIEVRTSEFPLPDNVPKVLHKLLTIPCRAPCNSLVLQHNIGKAEEILLSRVKGQKFVISKVVEMLKWTCLRSVDATDMPLAILSLSGPAHSGQQALLNVIAELVYGDRSAIYCIDCGEMREAHSIGRLIGAPLGDVGFDASGVLVTRLRERPKSILVFHEIEKAHKSFWDLIYGMTSSGSLMSANGQTVSLGETILVFTSSIGMFESIPDNINQNVSHRRPRFDLSAPYSDIEEGVQHAFTEYFLGLGRPEIIPRIALNCLIVFDFIRDISDVTMYFINLHVKNVHQKYDLDIQVPAEVVEYIADQVAATPDKLIYGTRGVREKVDSVFTEALVGFIFDHRCSHGRIDVSLDADKNIQFRLIAK